MSAMIPSALDFEGTTISIIDRDGHPWIAAADLARALGYTREDAVSRIFARNKSEFTDDMSLTVNLTVRDAVAEKPVRIFSARGCSLIAILARSAKAKAFRAWVLDVLDKVTARPAITAQPAAPLSPPAQRLTDFAVIDGALIDLSDPSLTDSAIVALIRARRPQPRPRFKEEDLPYAMEIWEEFQKAAPIECPLQRTAFAGER